MTTPKQITVNHSLTYQNTTRPGDDTPDNWYVLKFTLSGAVSVDDNLLLLKAVGTKTSGKKVEHFQQPKYIGIVRLVATTVVGGVLSGAGQTIDGKTTQIGDFVLLTAQGTNANGVWIVQSSAWTRPDSDATPSGQEMTLTTGNHAADAMIIASDGDELAGSKWICTNYAPTDVVGTDVLVWEETNGRPRWRSDEYTTEWVSWFLFRALYPDELHQFLVGVPDNSDEIDPDTGKALTSVDGRVDFRRYNTATAYFKEWADAYASLVSISSIIQMHVLDEIDQSLSIVFADENVPVYSVNQLYAVGGVGPYDWSFVDNVSGANLDVQTGLYIAGDTPGTDEIKLTDSTGATDTILIQVCEPTDLNYVKEYEYGETVDPRPASPGEPC